MPMAHTKKAGAEPRSDIRCVAVTNLGLAESSRRRRDSSKPPVTAEVRRKASLASIAATTAPMPIICDATQVPSWQGSTTSGCIRTYYW